MKEVDRVRPTTIGGQAVMEGVMMRNDFRYATAVRTGEDKIEIDKREYTSLTKSSKIAGLPLVRGGIVFIESLVMGVKILGFSADFFETEENEPSKFDKWLEERLGDNFAKVAVAMSVVFSLVLSIGLFFFLPALISQYLSPLFSDSTRVMNLIDGIIRLLILLFYMFAISFIKDIHRVFQYHGAEHKTINCYESGADMTVENVMKASRYHKRCGTNFVFIVVAVSIIVLVLINVESFGLRILVRLLTLPLIAGISYEILRGFGKFNNSAVTILSAPGMLLQRITTKEPDESMVEVAILSFMTVYETDKWEVSEGNERSQWEIDHPQKEGGSKNEQAKEDVKSSKDDDGFKKAS